MLALLRLVLKEKKEDNYNVLSSLKDVEIMLHNHRFLLDNLDSIFAWVEGYIVKVIIRKDTF